MNLRKHELIGREVTIVEATDPGLVGTTGRVVDETKNLLVVAAEGRARKIPKHGTRFRFAVGSGIEIDGDAIRYRPEDRIKKAR